MITGDIETRHLMVPLRSPDDCEVVNRIVAWDPIEYVRVCYGPNRDLTTNPLPPILGELRVCERTARAWWEVEPTPEAHRAIVEHVGLLVYVLQWWPPQYADGSYVTASEALQAREAA